ncbi:DUF5057 domain-containing protein [Anaerosporobacter sp.]
MEARKKKICLLLVIVLVLSLSVDKYSPANKTSNTALAKEIDYGINDILKKNTDDNQFTIVEIVPHKGLAQIGYSVSGQEPVQWRDYLKTLDTYKKRTDFLNTLLKEYSKVLDPYSQGILEASYTYNYMEKSKIPSTSDPSLWTVVDTFDESTSTQTGYFSFENAGDGDYRFSDNLNINYSDNSGSYYEFKPVATSSYPERAQYNRKAVSYKRDNTTGEYNVTFVYDYARNHTNEQAYVVNDATESTDISQDKKNKYTQYSETKYEKLGEKENIELTDTFAKFVLSSDTSKAKYKVLQAEKLDDLVGLVGFYDVKVDKQGNEVLDENGEISYVFNPNQTGKYNVTFVYDEAGTYEMDELEDFSVDDDSLRIMYYKKTSNTFESYSYGGDTPTHVVDFSPVSDKTEVNANARYYYVLDSEKVEAGSGYYGGNYKYVKTTAPNGEYVLELKDLDKYSGEVMTYDKGNGDYSWVEEEPTPFPETNYNATKIYVKDMLIKKSANFVYKGGLINSDRFKKTILGLSDEKASKFKIKVISVTPEELNDDYINNKSNSIINQADMFFISDNYEQSAFFMWSWENYTKEGMVLKDDERLTEIKDNKIKYKDSAQEKLTFNSHELSTKAMDAIVNRVKTNITIGDDTLPRAPLVYDVSLISRASSDNNVRQLYNKVTNGEFTDSELIIEPRVYENVYAYQEIENKVLFNNNFTSSPNYSTYNNSKYKNNFSDIIEDLQNEDIVRVANGLQPYGESLTPSNVIRYILNYESKRELIKKKSVTILEVQPSNSFTLEATIKKDVTSWVRYFNLEPIQSNADLDDYNNYNIKIVSMNSSEFIGKIEDLNSVYDMIYFGLDTGGMNRDEKTKQTLYNDTRMNGKIYTHVGDKVKASSDLLGLLDQDYYVRNGKKLGLKDVTFFWDDDEIGDQRYSGNDITLVKYNDLINYVDGNYPVLFEDGFYETYKENGIAKVEPNRTYLDGVSYMYQFADYCLDEGKTNTAESNIFGSKWDPTEEEKVKAAYFKTYLAIPKLEMKVSNKPTEYSQIENKKNKTTVTTYLKPDSNGKYVLSYKFSITDKVALVASDLSYSVKLYLDVDADGRFSDEEEMKGLTVKNGTRKVEADQLVLGKDSDSSTFTVTRELPKDYTGVVPWKIVIVRNSDDEDKDGYIRTSVNGYTAIEKKTADKEEVKILQINKWKDKNGYGSTLNLQEEFAGIGQGGTDSNYYKYGTNLNDFVLNVTTMTTDEYIQKIKADQNYLDQYNMIIMGFADCMPYLSNQTAVDKIVDFAKEGKCILFTHDTTMFSNVPKNTYLYNIYGENTNQKPDVANGGDNNTEWRLLCGLDRYGITKYVKGTENADYAVFEDKNSKDGKITIKETQGFTSQLLQRMALKVSDYTDKPTFNQYASPENTTENQLKNNSNGSSDWARTTEVKKVNEGQITNYPYKINDTITTSITHSQYYQLDMGDDVVVWYTLASDDKEVGSKRYDVLPNDVRNNYYIYNKGNITYSGVGHSSGATEMEAKLFINTMVAAYKAASEKPSVTITNESLTTNKDGEQFLYVDYDVQKGVDGDTYTNLSGEEKDGKSYIDVYYRVTNPNLDTNADLSVKYFVVDEAGNDSECPVQLATTTKANPNNVIEVNGEGKIQVVASNLYNTEDEQLDTLYCVKVPLEWFKNLTENKGNSSVAKYEKFKIKIYYVSNVKGKNIMENDTKVQFINRSLFDLQ